MGCGVVLSEKTGQYLSFVITLQSCIGYYGTRDFKMSIRIQFDIKDSEWKRLEKYIPNIKSRHAFGYIALMEWCTRKEGRDERAKKEMLLKDAKKIQELFDLGLIKI